MEQPLAGKVALVAGATRGAGRGIAVELGAAGATVYVTGRTTRAQRSEYDRPETIEETAELVTQAGGHGIALAVDHLEPEQVRRLVERIDRERGRHDLLVNDIWGGEQLFERDKPVWAHSLERGLRLLHLAVDTHLITNHFALPLLLRHPGGLVVEMTDGTTDYNARNYRVSHFYDLAKASVLRMAWSLAHELGPRGATAAALTPGWLRSEMMLAAFGVTEASWRDATAHQPHFVISETPRYVGRAVAALAAPSVTKVKLVGPLTSVERARVVSPKHGRSNAPSSPHGPSPRSKVRRPRTKAPVSAKNSSTTRRSGPSASRASWNSQSWSGSPPTPRGCSWLTPGAATKPSSDIVISARTQPIVVPLGAAPARCGQHLPTRRFPRCGRRGRGSLPSALPTADPWAR
jgi:NAD(P)-dependent dehydrogenase (short-subunit alcohol dehydrogenase family)